MKLIFLVTAILSMSAAIAKVPPSIKVRGECSDTIRPVEEDPSKAKYMPRKGCKFQSWGLGERGCTFWTCPRNEKEKQQWYAAELKKDQDGMTCYSSREENIAKASNLDERGVAVLKKKILLRHAQQWIGEEKKDCTALVEEDKQKFDYDSVKDLSDFSTCRWSDKIPRKIISGPGCKGRGKVNVCTGFVVCGESEDYLKPVQCKEDQCSQESAAACAGNTDIASIPPRDEEKLLVKSSLREVILKKGEAR